MNRKDFKDYISVNINLSIPITCTETADEKFTFSFTEPLSIIIRTYYAYLQWYTIC